MTEISGVSEHLLTECDSSDKFAQCPRCKEAVLKADLEEHFAEKKCSRKYLWRSVCLQRVLHKDHYERRTVSIRDSHDSCVIQINELHPCSRPNSDRVKMIHSGGDNCNFPHPADYIGVSTNRTIATFEMNHHMIWIRWQKRCNCVSQICLCNVSSHISLFNFTHVFVVEAKGPRCVLCNKTLGKGDEASFVTVLWLCMHYEVGLNL